MCVCECVCVYRYPGDVIRCLWRLQVSRTGTLNFRLYVSAYAIQSSPSYSPTTGYYYYVSSPLCAQQSLLVECVLRLHARCPRLCFAG